MKNKSRFCILLMFGILWLSGNIKGQYSGANSSSKDYGFFYKGGINVISSSHQDIAWMDSIGRCIEFRDTKMITPVLERLRGDGNFKFSVEDALCLKEYLHRHPESLDEIIRFTKEGRLDWGATYNQPYESMYDGESLIRQAYLGRKWLKNILPGCDFRTYWNEDVPGRTLQMAQILSKSGIPYMQFSRHQPGIYKWFSPDGSFITCFTPGQYDEAGIPVREAQRDIAKLTDVFTTMVTDWNGYYKNRQINPQLPFLYSHDFATPPDYDEFFKQWNSEAEELRKPSIQYATATEWFDKVTKGNPDFDKIVGERPNVWLYIHGPSHHKALQASREASRLLTTAEKFAACDALLEGSCDNYPDKLLTTAWENVIYPDHGWGGKHGDMTDRTFRTSFETARDIASDLVKKSTLNIASKISFNTTAIPVVIFNPLSWNRTDVVKFTLDVEGFDKNLFRLVDDKGKEIPYQLTEEHQLSSLRDEVITFLFVADDVPSLGYRTYYLEKEAPAVWPRTSDNSNSLFENRYYTIEFSDGGIKAIYDKELKINLLKTDKFLGAELFTMQSVGNGAGEFTDVQQPSMEGFEKLSQYHQSWSLVSEGPVCDVYQFTKRINHVLVNQKVILYKSVKRIDVVVDLNGFDGERYREFRMAFPLNLKNPAVAYEVPMGVVRVGNDEITGAAGFSKPSQIYSTPCAQVHPREVQDWFSASDGVNGVTISSDVAVFDYIDPTTDPAKEVILQPILLASRKSCHGEGNYYLQPGDHHYAFSFYSHTGDWKNGYRLGTQSNRPLIAVTVRPDTIKAFMPETYSFASVENPNLIISTVKKCEDDNSIILRCYDIEGKDTNAQFSFFKPFRKVGQTNMIEEEEKNISQSGSKFSFDIGHHAIETFKISF